MRRPLRLALVALLLSLRIVKQYEDHGRGPAEKRDKSRMRWGPCAPSRFSIRQRWNVRLFSGKTWKATSGASSESDARRSACATTPRRIETRTRTDASHPIGSEVTTAKRRSMGARGRCVDLSPSRFVDRHGEATCVSFDTMTTGSDTALLVISIPVSRCASLTGGRAASAPSRAPSTSAPASCRRSRRPTRGTGSGARRARPGLRAGRGWRRGSSGARSRR